MDAALFIRDADSDAIMRFWDRQLSGLEKLVLDAEPPQVTWDSQILSEIRPSAGKLKTVALAQLFRHHGLGGKRWICEFTNGFPITCDQSHRDVIPAADGIPARISCIEFPQSDAARFRERAAKSGKKNVLLMWTEAAGQVDKGWLAPPVLLHTDGRPHRWMLKGFDVAFLFGSDRAGNLRARGDLKRAMANLAYAVYAPIKLFSRDHNAQLSHLLSMGRLDLGMVMADRESTYKQLPIDPDDQA